MLIVRWKYNVKKTAFDFERSNALMKLFFNVRKTAFDFERLNALTKLFIDVKKTAFDFKRSNALTKLFDCQTVAFNRETIKCALTIVCDKNSLQSIDCNVICDEMSKIAFDAEIVECIDDFVWIFCWLKIHAKICS